MKNTFINLFGICAGLILFTNVSFGQQKIMVEGTLSSMSFDKSIGKLHIAKAELVDENGVGVDALDRSTAQIAGGAITYERSTAQVAGGAITYGRSTAQIAGGAITYGRSTAQIAGGAITYNLQEIKIGDKWSGIGTFLNDGTIELLLTFE